MQRLIPVLLLLACPACESAEEARTRKYGSVKLLPNPDSEPESEPRWQEEGTATRAPKRGEPRAPKGRAGKPGVTKTAVDVTSRIKPVLKVTPPQEQVSNLPRIEPRLAPKCRGIHAIDPAEIERSLLSKDAVPKRLEGVLSLGQAYKLFWALRARDVCVAFKGNAWFVSLYEVVGVRSIHGDKRGFWSQKTTLVLASGACLELPPPRESRPESGGEAHPSCVGDDIELVTP